METKSDVPSGTDRDALPKEFRDLLKLAEEKDKENHLPRNNNISSSKVDRNGENSAGSLSAQKSPIAISRNSNEIDNIKYFLETLPARDTSPHRSFWQPDTSAYNIRGITYLHDSVKVAAAKCPIMPLAHVDVVQVGRRADNFASHKSSWLQKSSQMLKDSFVLVINTQVTTLGISLVSYHVIPDGLGKSGDSTFDRMLLEFMNSDAKKRDTRLKFIPRISEGPWVCRAAVTSTPVIMGTKVTQRYFKGPNYFEIDVHADSSTIASSIISFVQGYANQLTVEFIWLLESQSLSELPERVMAACAIRDFNFSKAPIVNI